MLMVAFARHETRRLETISRVYGKKAADEERAKAERREVAWGRRFRAPFSKAAQPFWSPTAKGKSPRTPSGGDAETPPSASVAGAPAAVNRVAGAASASTAIAAGAPMAVAASASVEIFSFVFESCRSP